MKLLGASKLPALSAYVLNIMHINYLQALVVVAGLAVEASLHKGWKDGLRQ